MSELSEQEIAGLVEAVERLRKYGERQNDGKNDGTLFRFKDGGWFFLPDAPLPTSSASHEDELPSPPPAS